MSKYKKEKNLLNSTSIITAINFKDLSKRTILNTLKNLKILKVLNARNDELSLILSSTKEITTMKASKSLDGFDTYSKIIKK